MKSDKNKAGRPEAVTPKILERLTTAFKIGVTDEALNAENSILVTLDLPQPNQIISDLVELMRLFLPDIKRLGLAYSYR